MRNDSRHIDVNGCPELFCINIAGIHHGSLASFACPDADHIFHGIYEDNAVSRFSRIGCLQDRFNGIFQIVVITINCIAVPGSGSGPRN